MVAFSNAKINIGLQILGKRNDGFHDIQSCFYPVKLNDVIEINTQFQNSSFPIEINYSGIPINEPSDNNLCIKAFKIIKNDFPELPDIRFQLHKVIPTEAGLGGGSSNATSTLKLLNNKFDLGLSEYQLSVYASQLGSDCPFFISNTPSIIKGRGEIIEPLKINLEDYKILIVKPNISVSTKNAFEKIKTYNKPIDLKSALQNPVESWSSIIFNDFEKIIFPDHPLLQNLKDLLYKQGASYASMSGSGSSIYGIFKKDIEIDTTFPLYFSCWLN